MRHGGQTPKRDGNRVAAAGAETVDEPSGGHVGEGVGALEGKDDVGVGGLAPMEVASQEWLEDADDLAVDVVDGGGEKRSPQIDPAGVAVVRGGLGHART